MKTLIAVMGILFCVSNAAADDLLPAGCYVSFADSSVCYTPTGNFFWEQTTGFNALAQKFGPAAAAIIQSGFVRAQEREKCSSDLTVLNTGFQALQTAHATLFNRLTTSDANLKRATASNAKQTALAKKLRQVCGSRCRSLR